MKAASTRVQDRKQSCVELKKGSNSREREKTVLDQETFRYHYDGGIKERDELVK